MKILFYIAVGFVVFQFLRRMQHKAANPRRAPRPDQSDEPGDGGRSDGTDYKNAKDADFRDLH